jgi:serine/threonine-protein kinase RsbT
MPPSDLTQALNDLLAEYFSAPLAHVFVMTTLSRLDIDPSELSVETMPRVVRLLAEALPAYMSDAQRREQCMSRLLTLSPEGMAEPSRVAALPVDPADPLALPRSSRRPPKSSVEPPMQRAHILLVRGADDVGAACDAVRELSRSIGFAHVVETKIATAVAELARNLQLYAKGGEVHISAIGNPPRGVEIVAMDQGPGIPNLDHVLNGKYRSKTGMGMGLRGARKLMDTFDISSSPSGTRVMVRKYLA